MSCSCCNCIPCSCNTLSSIPACPVPVGCIPAVCVPDPVCVCGGAAKVFEEIDGFVLPAIDSGVTVSVKCVLDWLVGCCVLVKDVNESAFLRIDSIDEDNGTLFLVNIGAEGNPDPGYSFIDPTNILLVGECPESSQDLSACVFFKVDVAEAFTVPLGGSSSNITLSECLNVSVGQGLFIEGLGTVSIVSIVSNDPIAVLEITTTCLLPGVTVGVTSIPAGNYVTPSEICISTEGDLSGTGSSTDPLTVLYPSIIRCGNDQDVSGITPTGTGYAGEDLSNAFDNNEATVSATVINDTTTEKNIIWDLGGIKTGRFFALVDFRKAGAASTSKTRGSCAWDDTTWLEPLAIGTHINTSDLIAVESDDNAFKDKGVIKFDFIGQHVSIIYTGHIRFRLIKMFFEPFVC